MPTGAGAESTTGYRRLARNTGAILAGRTTAILLALLLSTVLFRTLGQQLFGLWSLFGYLVGYSTLIDFGLAAAVERKVAHLKAAGRVDEVARTVGVGVAIVLAAMLLAQGAIEATLLVLGSGPLGPLGIEARRGLRVLPAALTLVIGSLVVGSGLSGLQRLAVLHVWRTVGMAVGTATVTVLVFAGVRRIDALLLGYAAGAALAAAGQWHRLSRELPPRDRTSAAGLRQSRWSGARELLAFGGVLQVATFGPMLGEYLFRLILARRFGVEYAGLYDLAARAAFGLRSLVSSLFVAMVPFGVGVLATTDRAELARLVRLAVKYTALFMLPCSTILWILAAPVVQTWLGSGPGTPYVAAALRLLVFLHAFVSLTVPMAMIGRSAGTPLPEAITTWAGVAVGAATAFLAPSFLWAVGLFAAAPLGAGMALWVWLSMRFDIPFKAGGDLPGIVAVSAVTGLATAAAGWLAAPYAAHGVWTILPAGVAGGGAAVAATMLLRLISPRERALLESLARRSAERAEGPLDPSGGRP